MASPRGAPPAPYDAGLGEAIARVSRIVEPVVGPWLEATVRALGARRVLDVGCGTGVNLRWIARALPPDGIAVGIDRDPAVAASAQALLAAGGLADRVRAEAADLDALPDDLAAQPWDVVLLAQNVYYWPVAERVALLQRVRRLTGGTGTVLVLTAVPGANPIARSLDVVLRVTEGCARLPTRGELAADARAAGFATVRVTDVVPGAGLAALHASG
jgi:SAM-dependent methyltransferase